MREDEKELLRLRDLLNTSMATAGRTVTAESGIVDGEFFSNFRENVARSSAMVQYHQQGGIVNGPGPTLAQGHNYDFGTGPVTGFGGYTNEANANQELNNFADGENNELADQPNRFFGSGL
jgi:hypothetical protein